MKVEMMKTIITNEYRIYPTKAQEAILNEWSNGATLIYNAGRLQREWYGRKKGTDPFNRDILVSFRTQSKEMAYNKNDVVDGFLNDPELEWIAKIPRRCLDFALRDLEKAFGNFFSGRAERPTDRDENEFHSLCFQAWSGGRCRNVTFGRNSIKFPKIGRIAFKRHKKPRGKFKQVRIIKKGSEWYACVSLEQEPGNHWKSEKAVGADLGVKKPIALSTGEVLLENFGNEDDIIGEKIKKSKRTLARRQKGSQRRLKEKERLGRLERKRKRQRQSKRHQATTKIARENRIIAIEDLRVENMIKSAKGTLEKPGRSVAQKRGLNRGMSRVGLGYIRKQLEYKAERMGGTLVAVDARHTSQDCSKCGHRDKGNRKTQANFTCLSCGHHENADINAAKNILARGLRKLGVDMHPQKKAPSASRKRPATLNATDSRLPMEFMGLRPAANKPNLENHLGFQ